MEISRKISLLDDGDEGDMVQRSFVDWSQEPRVLSRDGGTAKKTLKYHTLSLLSTLALATDLRHTVLAWAA